jgi:hypothetical protein
MFFLLATCLMIQTRINSSVAAGLLESHVKIANQKRTEHNLGNINIEYSPARFTNLILIPKDADQCSKFNLEMSCSMPKSLV